MATVSASGELDSYAAARLARQPLRVAACHPQQLVLELPGAVLIDLPSAGPGA